MNNSDRVLAYLQSIFPGEATNAEIKTATGIQPHQQVFQITKRLMLAGKIRGRRLGNQWGFSALNKSSAVDHVTITPSAGQHGTLTPARFEALARTMMSQYYKVDLKPDMVPGVPKLFDLVSDDHSIVGDAKYYKRVGGVRLPPAKFATIAEYVWLLEKTHASEQFLVFGNDRKVPEMWLSKYRHLCSNVRFYFLTDDGQLSEL
jgi:hypothetical protein